MWGCLMKDKIEYCLDWIKKIKDSNSELNQDRVDALRYYRGDADIVKSGEGRSKANTTDMMDAIEWIKPSLLDIFASGNEVVKLQPASAEDVEAVKLQDLLINYQLRIKNKWFLVLHDWFDDMLKLKTGAVKYQWIEDVKHVDKEYLDLTEDQYQAKINEPKTEVLSHDQTENLVNQVIEENGIAYNTQVVELKHNIMLRHIIEDEYPLVEAVPAEEIGFLSTAKDIEKTFVYHQVKYEKWEFIKKYGKELFNKVEKEKNEYKENPVYKERYGDLGGANFLYDADDNAWFVYECYYNDPDTGDPYIHEICGDIELFYGTNKYGKPPFRIITPVRMAHRIMGLSMYDLVKDIQKIRTAMLRQILDNLYFANNRRYFGDPTRFNMDDYLNNNCPGALIRTQGDPRGAVLPEDNAPLPPELFSFWELINIEKDYHSGIPRSFQGVNPDELNKTWRGQSQQINQASQRIAMMSRIIAEMGIAPLVNDIVDLNIKFLKKETAVRYLNDWVPIHPDNIVGKYDVVVNVGIGTGDKDKIIMQMQQLLGIYAQIAKSGVPITNAQNVYAAMKELVQAMGHKNVQDFISDPKLNEAVQQLGDVVLAAGLHKDPQVAKLVVHVMKLVGGYPQQVNEKANSHQAPGVSTPQAAQPMPEATTPMNGDYFG